MGKYVRKTTRQSWTKTNLRAAINAVKLGVSKTAASKMYSVPKRTLLRYLDKQSEIGRLDVCQMGRYNSVFTPKQEGDLVKHIMQMANSGFGLTHKDIRGLAYQTAEKLNINHPFTRNKELAGPDWLRSFLRRHPELALRKAENTSLARIKGFNKEAVNSFYELLRRMYTECSYSPEQIYNVDETGFSTVRSLLSDHCDWLCAGILPFYLYL